MIPLAPFDSYTHRPQLKRILNRTSVRSLVDSSSFSLSVPLTTVHFSFCVDLLQIMKYDETLMSELVVSAEGELHISPEWPDTTVNPIISVQQKHECRCQWLRSLRPLAC
jgi:hypothetical protein